MTKQQIAEQALRNIQKRHSDAVDKNERTLVALRTHADFADNERALRLATVAKIMGTDEAQITKADSEIKRLTKEQKKLLAKYNCTEKSLTPTFFCNKCNDTGYVNEQPCECLREEIRRLLVADCAVPHPGYTFADSTEKDKKNLAIYRRAEAVCKNEHGNILLFGKVGTGKTYLLTACAHKCVELGKTVLFTTAYGLNQTFLEAHLSNLATKQAILDNLTDTDVLVIDDLGTEQTYKNVTQEYLFAVLNERLTNGKKTFISTNLSLENLKDKYDNRIFSRLIQQSDDNLITMLESKDKRTTK